jgi:hypothetical protein
MTLARDVAIMHVYEMDLVLSAAKMRQKADSLNQSTNSSLTSQMRLEVLYLCLKSAGQLAQNFLSIPASEHASFSYIQWSALIYAITIIYRLTVGIPQLRDWDVRVARATVDFDSILGAFCSRFNDRSPCDQVTLDNGDLFSMMGSIFENIRQSYDRLKHLPQDDSAGDTTPVHGTSFLSSALGYQHSCPTLQA